MDEWIFIWFMESDDANFVNDGMFQLIKITVFQAIRYDYIHDVLLDESINDVLCCWQLLPFSEGIFRTILLSDTFIQWIVL